MFFVFFKFDFHDSVVCWKTESLKYDYKMDHLKIAPTLPFLRRRRVLVEADVLCSIS